LSRNPDYQFINTDTEALVADLIAGYEQLIKTTVRPASPEKLFIQWVASIILQERVINNYTGNQNIPSRAVGAALDGLGELFYEQERPKAQAAVCTVRFHISEALETAILIPSGSRVTDNNRDLVWETFSDVYVPIGATYVDAQVRCQTQGMIGNGYAVGQINTMVDVYDYYSTCENITISDGGSDAATDEEYYELMRQSMDGYSCAGSMGGYEYFAKRVSTEIADVRANSPLPCRANIYVVMQDGSVASEEIKAAVQEACSKEYVRPMCDFVTVADPETVPFDIDFTYYIQSDAALSATEIQQKVQAAVQRYVDWQCVKFGRDILPDKLRDYLSECGIKRISLNSPVYTSLRNGKDGTVPQVAQIGTITINSGGYEDE
jgi:phage-related baseplate assembly protein